MTPFHRPFLLSSLLTPFLTTLSIILLIISATTASPVTPASPLSINQPINQPINQLKPIGPPICEAGSTDIGKQSPKPRASDCTSLAGQLRYDPSASEQQHITKDEHFLRGSGTCQLFIYTPPDGPDADDVSLNELADGVDIAVQLCLESPNYTGASFEAGNGRILRVWITGLWDPWPPGNQEALLEGAAENSTNPLSRPTCQDGSSVIGRSYAKPIAADCTALSQTLRNSPAASHQIIITRQERFIKRSGTCQLWITTNPMIQPSQDWASFVDLADGIDRVLETCINNPSYKGGSIQAGVGKLLTLEVTGIWAPFGQDETADGLAVT